MLCLPRLTTSPTHIFNESPITRDSKSQHNTVSLLVIELLVKETVELDP